MFGYYGHYSTEYLWALMVLTTLFFCVTAVSDTYSMGADDAVGNSTRDPFSDFFGRCLGALLLVIGCMALRALITGKGLSYVFDILFLVYIFMFFVHILEHCAGFSRLQKP